MSVLSNVHWWPMFAKVFYWVGITMGSLLLMALMGVIYYFLTFDHSVTVFPMYGSGKDGIFSVGAPKKNRVKWINNRTAWRSLYPLMNRKEREPFDSEYLYPGKRLFAFELNGEWTPGRININKEEDRLRAEINPVPSHVRAWQSLTYKKHEVEFAQHNWWEDNKYFFMVVISVGLCCLLCGVTIYFAFKFGNEGVAAAKSLTATLKSIGSVPAIGPQ